MLPLDGDRNAGATRRETAALRRLRQPLYADGQRASPAGGATSPATAARRARAIRTPHEKATPRRTFSPISASGSSRYPPLAAEDCAARWARHPACAEYVRELPLLGDVFQGARLPRDPLAALRPQALRARHGVHPVRVRVLSRASSPTAMCSGSSTRACTPSSTPACSSSIRKRLDAQNHFNCPIVVVLPREHPTNNVEAAADGGRASIIQPVHRLHEREDRRRPAGRGFCREQWQNPESEVTRRRRVALRGTSSSAPRPISAPRARACSNRCEQKRTDCGVVLAGRPYHRRPGDQPRHPRAHRLLRP